MKKIRYGLLTLSMLLCLVTGASAGVSIGIGLPNVSIGINLPLFPDLAPIPGYPVYYAPRLDANYFFYDGMYWVYQDDNWYASSWYNGPWSLVEPNFVPLYILRIPVRYYRQPPVYFRGWQPNAPPRWGQHWGHRWEQRHRGWNRWDRRAAPAPAPLPTYQRRYSGERYPRVEQQPALRNQSYRYQPRERAVREHFRQEYAPAQRGRQEAAPVRGPRQNDQMQQPRAVQPQREQQAPRVQERNQGPRDRGESAEPDRGRGRGQGDEGRGRGRD